MEEVLYFLDIGARLNDKVLIRRQVSEAISDDSFLSNQRYMLKYIKIKFICSK